MEVRFERLTIAEPRHEWIHATLSRAQVPGGWLLSVFWATGAIGGTSIAFYPDPKHEWAGDEIPEEMHQSMAGVR